MTNANELEKFVKDVLNVVAIQGGAVVEMSDQIAMHHIRGAATHLTDALEWEPVNKSVGRNLDTDLAALVLEADHPSRLDIEAVMRQHLDRIEAAAWDAGWIAGCNDQQYGDENAHPWTPNPYRSND